MVDKDQHGLDDVFHALADPTRRDLLRRVAGEEKTVTDLALPYNMSLAAVSKHLDVLERADLIRRQSVGRLRIVRLNAVRLQLAQDWLAFYEKFWNARMDALQSLLESPNPKSKKEK
jgi:DNA-binding transcriptional ArsR family regulator